MIFSRVELVDEDVLGISEYFYPAGERVLLAYKLEGKTNSFFIHQKKLDSGEGSA